jgi:uncharacterized protein
VTLLQISSRKFDHSGDMQEILILRTMNRSDIKRPLINAGWLRALLYAAIFYCLYFAAVHLNMVNLGMKMSSSAPVTPNANPAAGQLNDSLHLGIFALLVFVLTFVFRRWIDRKSFVSLGLDIGGHLAEAAAGGSLAIFIIGASSLILKGTGDLKWMDIIFDPKSIFMALGTLVLAAVFEELIFRGYILTNLLNSFPRWPALLISALVFMLFHWTSDGLFPMINMFIMGMIMGLNYTYTRNLWFSISFHICWKFLEGPVMGLSGTSAQPSLLITSIQGNENATGGAYGLEGSYMLAAISLLSLLGLYFFLQKKFSPQSLPVPGRI